MTNLKIETMTSESQKMIKSVKKENENDIKLWKHILKYNIQNKTVLSSIFDILQHDYQLIANIISNETNRGYVSIPINTIRNLSIKEVLTPISVETIFNKYF